LQQGVPQGESVFLSQRVVFTPSNPQKIVIPQQRKKVTKNVRRLNTGDVSVKNLNDVG
jgi:hypothetical protein